MSNEDDKSQKAGNGIDIPLNALDDNSEKQHQATSQVSETEDKPAAQDSENGLLVEHEQVCDERFLVYSETQRAAAQKAVSAISQMNRNTRGGYDKNPLSLSESLKALGLIKYAGQLNNLFFDISGRNLSPREVIVQVFSQLAKVSQEFTTVSLFNTAAFPEVLVNNGSDKEQCRTNPEKVEELKNLAWVEDGKNVHLFGASGLGKTTLALELGKAATCRGYSTLFVKSSDLFIKLGRAHANNIDVSKSKFCRKHLLIIDDIGRCFPESVRVADMFYTLIDYRNTAGLPTLFTSSVAPDIWVEKYVALGSNRQAALERIMLESYLLEFDGESFRTKHFKELNPDYFLE